MQDEFKKLIDFFSLESDDKAKNLEGVFDDASVFLDRFKEVFQSGTMEEKQEFMGKIMELQSKIKEETNKLCETSGLSEEQVMQFAMNPDNFPKEQWDLINRSKEKLESKAQDIQRTFQGKGDNGKGPDEKPPKTGPGMGWTKG